MMSTQNPYQGNILIERLRPILSREQALSALTYHPAKPKDVENVPLHIRLHYLMMLRELHIPSSEEARLQETVDLLIRNSLHLQNPACSQTWGSLMGEEIYGRRPKPSALAALIAGFPGTGKTSAAKHILGTYEQVIEHSTFPMSSKPLKQVVWVSCDVPASGRATHFAESLMRAWDLASGENRFANWLGRSHRDGPQMINEWCQVASSQFLAILHLDEIQNFFKNPTLARRRSSKASGEKLELSLVEDACLKLILYLINTKQISLLFSGTPDGVEALTKRLSTIQRFTTGGYHHFKHFETEHDPYFRHIFLPDLIEYQFVAKPIKLSDDLAKKIFYLSGGLLRIIIALWISAHRIAFERAADDLTLNDFDTAAKKFLAPLQPIISAIHSRDPTKISQHDDLLREDNQFWSAFWSPSN